MSDPTAAHDTSAPAEVVAADVSPLPGRGAFDGDVTAHRRWYRTNIVALVCRPDLNNQKIAAAAEVSNTTVSHWFVDATGIKPQQYRAQHRLPKHTATPTSDRYAPDTLVSRDRVVGSVECWDGVEATVVADLRAPDRCAKVSTGRVLAHAPNLTEKQWRCTVTHGSDLPGWDLHGYGLGTNKDHASSVLLATQSAATTGTGADTGTWRMAFIVDGRAHGKFALSWAKETMPTIAAALTHAGGKKTEHQWRYADAQRAGYRALDSLGDVLEAVLEDPASWAGDLSVPVPGWDGEANPWSRSVDNVTLLLRWAAAGVTRRDLIATFRRYGWGPDGAYALRDDFGVDDVEGAAQVLTEWGGHDGVHNIAWQVQQRTTDLARP